MTVSKGIERNQAKLPKFKTCIKLLLKKLYFMYSEKHLFCDTLVFWKSENARSGIPAW
jgi:hypothetical protein